LPENVLSTLPKDFLGNPDSDVLSIGTRAPGPNYAGAVGRGEEPSQVHRVIRKLCRGARRQGATRSKAAEKSPLGKGFGKAWVVVHQRCRLAGSDVSCAKLDPHNSLAWGGHEFVLVQGAGHAVMGAKAFEGGAGHEKGFEIACHEAGDAGVHVAPHGHHEKVGAGTQYQGLPPKAPRGHAGPGRELG